MNPNFADYQGAYEGAESLWSRVTLDKLAIAIAQALDGLVDLDMGFTWSVTALNERLVITIRDGDELRGFHADLQQRTLY